MSENIFLGAFILCITIIYYKKIYIIKNRNTKDKYVEEKHYHSIEKSN